MTSTAAADDVPEELGDATSHRVQVDDVELRYFEAGEAAETLLLLHGGIIDAAPASWGGLIQPLAEDATVIAPDLAGYGASELPDGPLSLADHVDYTAKFLDALDLESATVAGISMGGGIGIGLGLREPERVDHLVALDAYGLGSDLANGWLTWGLGKINVTNRLSVALMRRNRSFLEASLGNITHDPDALPDAAIESVVREVHRPNAGAAFRKFRKAEVTRRGYRTTYEDRLHELDVPTRLIHGREDEIIPVEWAERAADLIPDADLHVFEECGHWPTRERPEDVRELIVEVL